MKDKLRVNKSKQSTTSTRKYGRYQRDSIEPLLTDSITGEKPSLGHGKSVDLKSKRSYHAKKRSMRSVTGNLRPGTSSTFQQSTNIASVSVANI